MKKGNETEVLITLKIPGQETPMAIPGVFIMEGMTEKEIEYAMLRSTRLLVEYLVRNGSMRYFPKEIGKIEGLVDLPRKE